MIVILFTPSFDRLMRKINAHLLAEVSDAVELFKDPKNHKQLKVHKLRGRLARLSAFSVDYRHRVVFQWIDKKHVLLLDFGDHAVYE